jgi:uncharacterized protein YjeT (DUF2065 family)
LGGFWLLSNLGLISAEFWEVFWPVVIILLGLKMLFGPHKWRKFWSQIEEGKKIKIE